MSFKDTFVNFMIFIVSIAFFPIFIYEYQIRDPLITFFLKISISLLTLGVLIWYFYEYNEDDEDYSNINVYEDNIFYNPKKKYNYMNNNISYCQRTDVDTYDAITKAHTREELKKLMKTEKFRRMAQEKGEDKENWNWQSRDRLAGKKQPNDSDIGSDEIENLSLSDD